MHYLSVEDLAKQFGEISLFQELTFGVSRGEKVALVAKNGAGKSTLLRILAQQEEPDAGTVAIREGIRMVLLPQDPDFDPTLSIDELIKSQQSGLMDVINAYEKALDLQTRNHNKESEAILTEAANKMDMHQAWDYDRRLTAMLQRFNILDLSQKVSSLSGGQKKRLSLALTLLDSPDLLLLDEPTNHRDIEMIEWKNT